jgi:lysophospholipid acyltransferase (LPLAT)-like uncharacterized protein
MKIRNAAVLRVLGFFVGLLVKLWVGTLRYRYRPLGRYCAPYRKGATQRWLYAMWHEALLVPAFWYSDCNGSVMISQHGDGEMITAVCRVLRIRVVRGSTTRNASGALRQMVRAAETGHLILTCDGPRGPRQKVQPGLVYLAARTGTPIVPIGMGFARAWRARSWDRFAVPLPFSAVWAVTGEPVFVPANASRADLELYTRRVQQAMDEATATAQRLAGEVPVHQASVPVEAARAA